MIHLTGKISESTKADEKGSKDSKDAHETTSAKDVKENEGRKRNDEKRQQKRRRGTTEIKETIAPKESTSASHCAERRGPPLIVRQLRLILLPVETSETSAGIDCTRRGTGFVYDVSVQGDHCTCGTGRNKYNADDCWIWFRFQDRGSKVGWC